MGRALPRTTLVALCVAWACGPATSIARADDSAPEWTFAESNTGVDWAAAPIPVRSARHLDAHADRVLIGPTAETHPAGTLYVTGYEVIIPSVGYAWTDHLQTTLTGFTTFRAGFVELNFKANLLRSRWLRVAATTSIDYVGGDSNEGDDEATSELLFGRAGGTLQVCFELQCRTSFSMSAMVVAHDIADTILPLGLAAGFTAHVSDEATLLLEASSLFNASRDLAFIPLPVFLIGYGVRVSAHPSWALDLSLMRELASDDAIRATRPGLFDLLGVPFVAFTYRWQP